MFSEYIAKDRVIDTLKFDFLIANKVGKEWYDGDPDQYMPERAWCLSQIKEGFTIVDCGAHHGMMTIIFSLATGTAGKVISYEALPENAGIIERNVELNNLSNILVRPVGVGAENGLFEYNDNLSNIVVNSASDGAQGSNMNTIEIVTLDGDLAPDIQVDFIKIDVEGHDVEALNGMKRIRRQRPIIDLELHNFLFADVKDSLETIKESLEGYQFTVLGEIFGEPRWFGSTFDTAYIAQYSNPHLFCIPD